MSAVMTVALIKNILSLQENKIRYGDNYKFHVVSIVF